MSMTTAAAPDARVPFARLSSTSNNWVSWILRAGAELKGKGVYLYATGKVPQVHEPVRKQIPSPTDPAGLAAHAAATQTESDRYDRELIRYLEWQTKDDLATSVIVKLIDETQDVHIEGATTSYELLTRLQKAHVETSSGVTAFYTKVGMLQRKYIDGESMQAHISALLNDNARLRASKDESDDKFIAQLLLLTLPQSTTWEMLTVALLQNTTPSNPLTVSDVTARLLQEAARVEGGTASAMSAKTSSSSRPPKTPGSRSSGTKEKCTYCKIEGHSEKVCRRKQREDTVRAEEREKMKKEMKGKHGKATAAKASTVSASRVPDSDDESSSDSDHDVKAHFTRERVFVTSLLTTESPKHVYMDSGASRHISPNLAMFDPASTRALSPPIAISTADGNIIHAKTEGTLLFDLKYDGKVERGRFERALHAPDLTTTLISVSQLTRTGIDVNFSGDVCNILDRTKQVIGQAHHTRSSLYRLTGKPVTTTETAAVASTPSIDVNLLHQRLGHLGHKNVQRLLRDKLVTGIGAVEGTPHFCEPCTTGKQHRSSFLSHWRSG
ncbi:hypothetical protein D9615_002165 [Tricholomella constricta]|uniref:GAG-pre-integrase domain-containing protein n=1 Tax=Tricholomella constricta TaxID=117010 RepID=A0A8H5HPK8_9AGAR|nr:hypothetical protein D9615_002165 [Tricholomella constricta]